MTWAETTSGSLVNIDQATKFSAQSGDPSNTYVLLVTLIDGGTHTLGTGFASPEAALQRARDLLDHVLEA